MIRTAMHKDATVPTIMLGVERWVAVGREPPDGLDALVVAAVRVQQLLRNEGVDIRVTQRVVHERAALVVILLEGSRDEGMLKSNVHLHGGCSNIK